MTDFFMVIRIVASVAALFRTDQPVAAGLLVGIVLIAGALTFCWRRSVRLSNSCLAGGSVNVRVV